MKNALNNQVGMLGDMFLRLVANLKQGVIYFIKQALPPNISVGSVVLLLDFHTSGTEYNNNFGTNFYFLFHKFSSTIISHFDPRFVRGSLEKRTSN